MLVAHACLSLSLQFGRVARRLARPSQAAVVYGNVLVGPARAHAGMDACATDALTCRDPAGTRSCPRIGRTAHPRPASSATAYPAANHAVHSASRAMECSHVALVALKALLHDVVGAVAGDGGVIF